MSFRGFDRKAIRQLRELPRWNATQYAAEKAFLRENLIDPGAALITSVADALDCGLTVDRRSSVSPLHRDLRFAAAGAALKKVPSPWEADHPREDLLRLNGFQLRFQEALPKSVDKPPFARWCTTRLSRLLPVHEWLVEELQIGRKRR